MIALVVLALLISATHAFQYESQVIIRRQSYASAPAASGDWVRVDLHRDFGDSPTVKRIYWCRTLLVKEVASRASIAFSAANLLRSLDGVRSGESDCGAPGLLHMQLYPGLEAATFQPETEPGAIYIDPAHFESLWDDKHAMNVVVEMRINSTTTAQQVTRFNQPHNRQDEDTTTTTTLAPTTAPAPGHSHPWFRALLFLCGGGLFFAGVVAFRLYRTRRATMNRGALLLVNDDDEALVPPSDNDDDSDILRSVSGNE